jgi:hypothetical protein
VCSNLADGKNSIKATAKPNKIVGHLQIFRNFLLIGGVDDCQ